MGRLYKESTGFTQISNDIITNPNMSIKAKAVYCYLFSRPDGWVFYRSEIVKNFKESIKTIDSALKELADAGIIRKIQIRNKEGLFKGFNVIISSVTLKSDTRETDTRILHTNNIDRSNKDNILSVEDIKSPTVDESFEKNPEKRRKSDVKEVNKPFINNVQSFKESIEYNLGRPIKINLNAWCNDLRLLEKEVGHDRVIEVLSWYDDNMGKEYICQCESMSSFRSKFVKLEMSMNKQGGRK